MAITNVIRRISAPLPATLLCILLLGASFLLTFAAQPQGVFGGYYSALLVLNIVGIVLLSALILSNLWRLVRQFRQRVLGSRLTVRFLTTFVLLTLLPLSVVYYFAVQFLSKGIDSWFDVRIEQALDDALLLGRTTLETIKQDVAEQVARDSQVIADAQSEIEIIRLSDELRDQGGYTEFSVFDINGRIVASSSADAGRLLPESPDDAVWSDIRNGDTHTSLEPMQTGGLRLRIAMPVYSASVSAAPKVIQVIQPLPLRYSSLGESVQLASAEYEKLQYLRGPINFSFVLTLTLVSLMALLMAFWGAFFSARRLVAPLRDLAEGTRSVAQGIYDTRLPVNSSDELGVLVQSFNDMTGQIHQAQNHAQRSQYAAEAQHTYLETVLGHLSTGVMSFDAAGNLRTFNKAAADILDADFEPFINSDIDTISEQFTWTDPLLSALSTSMKNEQSSWQKEIKIFSRQGRKSLICRATPLPKHDDESGGYVIVFDNVTELIQAQRDAAWGEVARRLAHEIKNPLTPIQLSAERIRHKYLHQLDEQQRDAMDRATRTIIQQVESMKQMVNEFSNYAQPVGLNSELIDINRLVTDVAELHQRDEGSMHLQLELANDVSEIEADSTRLRQVLNNLIINAQHACAHREAPVTKISTRQITAQNQSVIEIALHDNGDGFPPELLDRIFEPYVTTKEKGTGLGLAIVKRIVDEHSGTITTANSERGGAIVTLRLPVSMSDRPQIRPSILRASREISA